MNEPIKPPMGLRPEFVFKSEQEALRVKEIREAMARYLDAGLDIPNDWLQELSRRTAKVGTALSGIAMSQSCQSIERAGTARGDTYRGLIQQ